ncbi:MAG TPA: hypothetical protein VMX57_01375 [Planctomycetota bacterium]|nr:hypothetical protein [Planctomycetota bacterium]
MTDANATEHAALRERTRRMLDALRPDAPEGFDPAEKLVFHDNPAFDRTGFMVGQRSLDYAFILLETGRDAGLASDIIDKCLRYQDLRDPASPTYGNFFWYTNWTEVIDPNAVSFMAPHFWRIWTRHRAKLRPDTARTLEARFPLILNGLMKQPWCHWAYTNIFLLTIAGRLMISSITGDDAARDETVRQWEEWIEKTSRFGIPEFNSPSYAGVDIFSLLDMREAAPDERMRREIEHALEYFFLELFLHYHPATGLLTGAFSRAYADETTGGLRLHGPVEALCYHQLGIPLDGARHAPISLTFSDYLAPRWIRDLALEKPLPLTVDATSGWEKGHWVRRNFMTGRYAVGSFSNSFYSILQVPVFVALVPPIVPRTSGSEGNEREGCATSAGERTLYTRSEPELGTCYADQLEDSVLAAFCYNFADPHHRYGPVGSGTRRANLCLHLGRVENPADLLIDGKPWDGTTRAMSSGTPVVLHVGTVSVGVIPIAGQVCIDDDEPVVLVADDAGARLEIILYHGDVPAEQAFPRAQAGFYLRVAEGALDLSKVAVSDTFEGDAWHVQATDGDRRLAVRAPLSAENVFADAPKVGTNQPEPGWLLRSPCAELRTGEFPNTDFRTR